MKYFFFDIVIYNTKWYSKSQPFVFQSQGILGPEAGAMAQPLMLFGENIP